MRNILIRTVLVGGLALTLSSCGAQKELEAMKVNYNQCLDTAGQKESTIQQQKVQIQSLQDQIALLKKHNDDLQKIVEDNAVNSGQRNANIEQLIGQIKESSAYIKRLQDARFKQDSLMLAISNKLKRSLTNLNDSDFDVKVQKGVVFISLSDHMMFSTGSYQVNPAAQDVLAKVAKVLNDYASYDVLIEGNTDNVPIVPGGFLRNNWDLSALRATSIAKILQDKYSVDPSRMTAGGRSEYNPKTSNDTPQGRQENRRTEIIVLPKLDQFMDLINQKM